MGRLKFKKQRRRSYERTYFCRNGHLKADENLVIRNDYRGPGWVNFTCRICERARWKRHRSKKK